MDRRCGVSNTLTTHNQTSELKNQDFFIHLHQIRKNDIFLSKIGNKIKQSQVTNHTLEKPNDLWQLHLPLVISLKSTHIPVTHLRYKTPPCFCTKRYRRYASVAAMGDQVAARCRQTDDFAGDTQRVQPLEHLRRS